MPKRGVLPDDLLRFNFVSEPRMHPDGREVLFTRKWVDKNRYKTQLMSCDMQGKLRTWTREEFGASHGRWSPTGDRIAFLSKREGTNSQIHVLSVAGGEAKAITHMPEGDFAGFRWAPDGKRIAFMFRERDPQWTEKARKERDEKGLSTPARVINTPYYRLDGEGYFLDTRYAIYVVDAEGGDAKEVFSEGNYDRYSYDWSPDGRSLAVSYSAKQNIWRDPEDDRIVILDLKGTRRELKGLPQGEKRTLRWSPDGKWLAYIVFQDPLDHRGIKNAELSIAPIAGGNQIDLTNSHDYDLEVNTLNDMGEVGGEFLEWQPDSSGLFVSVGWHGANHPASVDLTGQLIFLTEGNRCITAGSVAQDGKSMACLVSHPGQASEVALLKIGKGKADPRQLTSLNSDLLDQLDVRQPEELWLEAEDGYPVHVWVIRPKGKRSKRHPAVLQIHGGPQAQYGWTYFHEFQTLASAGYTVVYSNPRGSKGYGASHCAAISGAWGTNDWLDIQAVLSWMKAQPDIDSNSLGVEGGSYGGYLVNWVVGHTHDFRAAITDRCVSNLMAKALNSDYPYFPGTFWQGSGYGPLESNADLWRDSPIAYFDKVETPMLIIHSEGDLRCNIEQGEQVFTTLQERGIPSRFVRYPESTSHGMSRGGPPDLRLHRMGEILKWWERWLR